MTISKLTLDDIQSKIESAIYLNPVGTLTIAILTLTNGYIVTGESACLNPADFDADLGKKLAYENAEEKIWMLEGYLRKEIAYGGYDTPMPDTPMASGKNTITVDLPTVAVEPHDDMVAYLGVKIVNAKPMSRGVYVQLRGWDLPGDEDPADAGYLVEYTDAQRPNVTGFQGYVSWSPADVFMAAYRPLPAPAVGSTATASNGTTAGGADAGNAQASSNLADPSSPAPVSGGA